MMMNNSREKASLVFKDTELSLWNDMQRFSRRNFSFFFVINKEEFYNKRETMTSLRPTSQVEKIESKCR